MFWTISLNKKNPLFIRGFSFYYFCWIQEDTDIMDESQNQENIEKTGESGSVFSLRGAVDAVACVIEFVAIITMSLFD